MKKTICCIAVVLSVFMLFAVGLPARNMAMGNTCLNVTSTQNNSFYNPASVYFYGKQSTFIINFRASDNFTKGKLLLPEKPYASVAGTFVSKNMSLLVDLSFDAIHTGETVYNMSKSVKLGLNAAAGFSDFAAGVGVYLHSTKQKTADNIDTDRVFLDLLEKGIFNEFPSNSSFSGANVKAGIGYLSGKWSGGILFDDFIDSSTGGKALSFERFVNSFGMGVGYNSDKYTTRGRLNKWVFASEIEFSNIFSGDIAFRGGAEITCQLVRNKELSFRAGTEIPLFNGAGGSLTMGLGARLGELDINTCLNVPFSTISNLGNFDVSATLDMSILL